MEILVSQKFIKFYHKLPKFDTHVDINCLLLDKIRLRKPQHRKRYRGITFLTHPVCSDGLRYDTK